MKRERGRPKKADAPIVPWEEVDRLLVFGEKVVDEKTGHENIRYPSFAELGQRYGVSKSRVWKYAKARNCLKRREESRAREEIKYEQKVIEKRAEARALSTDDEIRIIDDYLRGFEKALAENRVRYDNPADFNTMVRLKEFKLGHADSRQEIKGFLSLEEIQARHKRLRDQLDGMEKAVSGTTSPPDSEPQETLQPDPPEPEDPPAEAIPESEVH